MRRYTSEDVDRISAQQKLKDTIPKTKRKHRRTHGKISFDELARVIANNWKNLDGASKAVFGERAAIEKNQYNEAIHAWSRSKLFSDEDSIANDADPALIGKTKESSSPEVTVTYADINKVDERNIGQSLFEALNDTTALDGTQHNQTVQGLRNAPRAAAESACIDLLYQQQVQTFSGTHESEETERIYHSDQRDMYEYLVPHSIVRSRSLSDISEDPQSAFPYPIRRQETFVHGYGSNETVNIASHVETSQLTRAQSAQQFASVYMGRENVIENRPGEQIDVNTVGPYIMQGVPSNNEQIYQDRNGALIQHINPPSIFNSMAGYEIGMDHSLNRRPNETIRENRYYHDLHDTPGNYSEMNYALFSQPTVMASEQSFFPIVEHITSQHPPQYEGQIYNPSATANMRHGQSIQPIFQPDQYPATLLVHDTPQNNFPHIHTTHTSTLASNTQPRLPVFLQPAFHSHLDDNDVVHRSSMFYVAQPYIETASEGVEPSGFTQQEDFESSEEGNSLLWKF